MRLQVIFIDDKMIIIMSQLFSKSTFRSIIRNKYNWINIFGLTVSISVFMAIFLYIQNEYSYEKHHEKLNNLYRIEQFQKFGETRNMCGAPPPLSLVITKDIPEIELSTRYIKNNEVIIELPDGSKLGESDIIFADKAFLKMFTFPVVKGSPDGDLDQPYMAVITEEVSTKYFGSQNPIGKILKLNNGFDFEVRAVVKQLSKKSHLNFNILISFNTLLSLNGPEIVTEDWFSNWTKHYVLINQNANVASINEKLKDYLKKYQGEESENELYLKPVRDIHLNSTVVDETANVGSAQNVTIFSLIAFMIIIVACINYINLTTAYSTIRGKEVGIHKVNGADRTKLIFRFLGESFIISVISLILGVILTEFIFPYFNQLVNRNIEINYLGNWQFYLTSFLICGVITLISGIYPAFLLANFKATEVLKGTYQGGQKKGTFRRILVIFQFFISVSLVISTIFLVKQLNFMSNSDLGYDKDNVLIIDISSPSDQKLNQFKSEIEVSSDILMVTSSDYLPMNSHNWTGFTWEGAGEEEFIRMNINYVGPEFLDVYDIPLNTGTGFTPEQSEQDQLYVIINEQAVKEMGWDDDDVLGRKILWFVDYRTRYEKEATVAGIVNDYHYLSKHHSIKPLIMPLLNNDASGSRISIKLISKPQKETLGFIETKFQEIFDSELWNYQFADNIVHSQYDKENRMSQLVLVLTVIGIIIAITGLYGLTSFITNQRVKEIGIRKVMGASLSSILYIISKELLIMLALANLIAWPLAYLLVLNWLQNFEYQIEIQPYVFILATAITFILAIITVGFKILKTTFRNPVEALRYE